MKNCHAVRLIRAFDALPDTDARGFIRRTIDRVRGRVCYTKEDRWRDNPPSALSHAIVKNRDAWTRKELGYE